MTGTDAKIAEILRAFEINEGVYQREAVDAAIELKEEITPHLINLPEQVLANPSKYIDIPSYILPLDILALFKCVLYNAPYVFHYYSLTSGQPATGG